MKKPFVFLFGLLLYPIFAQQMDKQALAYPKSIIRTLTSEEFAGRGYMDNGMQKSAAFIADEFEKLGLKKIGDSYFQ